MYIPSIDRYPSTWYNSSCHTLPYVYRRQKVSRGIINNLRTVLPGAFGSSKVRGHFPVTMFNFDFDIK